MTDLKGFNENRHCTICKNKLTPENSYKIKNDIFSTTKSGKIYRNKKSGSMVGICKDCNKDVSYMARWSSKTIAEINFHIESLVHKIGLLNNIKYKRELEKNGNVNI